jgi:hypothetical protein
MRFIQYFRAWGALAACLAVLLFHVKQSAGAPKWTDRNEYDLVLAVRAEAAPQKRLALLDQWKAKYPKTDLRQTREELYLSVYQSLGDSPRMLAAAREMVSGAPDNLVGLYWYTLLVPEAKETPADLLDTGEKAARRLLAGLDTYFAAGGKPAGDKEVAVLIRNGAVAGGEAFRGMIHGLHAVGQQVGSAAGVDERSGSIGEVGRRVLVLALHEGIDDGALRILMPDAVTAHALDGVEVLAARDRQRLPGTGGEMVAGAHDGAGSRRRQEGHYGGYGRARDHRHQKLPHIHHQITIGRSESCLIQDEPGEGTVSHTR